MSLDDLIGMSRWPRRFGALAGVGLLGVLLSFAGCDSGEAEVQQAASCVPGETRFCSCPPRLEGTQVCNEQGNSYSSCDCGGTDVGSTPDASGDVNSSLDSGHDGGADVSTDAAPDAHTADTSDTSNPDSGPAGSCPAEGCGCTHYVSTTGSSSADGRSPQNAWSLSHAFAQAGPGDTVCVAAGDYGDVTARLTNSGRADAPIRFFGYGTTPGDVLGVDGRSSFVRGDSLDANKMPLLDGGDGTGVGITVDGEYVEIVNFQLTRYTLGVHVRADHARLENIVGVAFGDQGNSGAYNGFGLRVEASNATISRSFVQDANAEGIRVSSSRNSVIELTEVYGKNANAPMDYYFVLTDTHDSLIEDSVAYREPGLEHNGHGFDMKDKATNNVVRGCKAYQTSLEVNFSGVHDNLFEDCEVYGTGTNFEAWAARIAIFNGAHHNTFKNILLRDVWTAVNIADYDDGFVAPDGDRDEVATGSHNRFVNLVVHNANRVLNHGGGQPYSARGDSNHFYNCTFHNIERLAVNYNANSDFRFVNCVIDTVTGGSLWYEGEGDYAPYSDFDVTFDHVNLSNASFGAPSGTAVTTHDPQFSDAAGGDFTLQSGSALIDAGKDTSYPEDFAGNARPAGSFDLGAFERVN